MANIYPFSALHYDTHKIGDLSKVIVPPYDNIPKEEEAKYFTRSPYNFANVILPKVDNDDYSDATRILHKWIELGILHRTSIPSYFIYEQSFTIGNNLYHRDTLMCTVELSDFSEGIVLPHENTHGKYKEDRLNILRKTQCNLSHVFAMVKDPEGYLASQYEAWKYRSPILRGKTDDGAEHTVWQVEENKAKDLQAFFQAKPIYIVDGHHRYGSALTYAKETNAFKDATKPASRMLFSIANSYDPSLIVMPTHRLIRDHIDIKKNDIEKDYELFSTTFEEFSHWASKPPKTPAFGVYFKGQLYIVRARTWRSEEHTLGRALSRLPVYWSDERLLKDHFKIDENERSNKIIYEKDMNKLWNEKKETDLIILHPTPSVLDVTDVADEGKFMPQKSTYFFPKLAAGLIARDLTHGKA